MSRRDGGAHAATLVFLLESKVDTRSPLKRIRAEGPLYEMQQFEINVANPFQSGGFNSVWFRLVENKNKACRLLYV